MKVVGIDIGTHSVHVVELLVQSRGYQIISSKSHPIKPKPNQTDVDLEVIEYLRTLVASQNPAETHYVVGLKQNLVTIRHKVFPYTEKMKIAKTLPFELEDDLPFAPESAFLDFKSVRHRGNEAEILACATLASTVEKIVTFFKDVGIEIRILCPEGLALANLVENHDSPIPVEPSTLELTEGEGPKRTLELLLHIGHTQTLICAFENKRQVASRSLFWGGRNVSDAIALKYQLPLADAQREMETKAFILSSKQQASFEAKVFSDTISNSVKEMVRDLQLTILEIKSELHADVDSILVSGAVSQIQGLSPFLTQCLEIPTNRVRLWERFAPLSVEKNESQELGLLVALGLALESLKKPRNPATNLLKGDFAKNDSPLVDFLKLHKRALQFGLASLIALFIWSSWRATYGEGLSEVAQKALRDRATAMAGLSSRSANERGVQKFIKQKKQISTEMKGVEKLMQTETAFNILKKFSEITPSSQQIKLDIRRFYVEDKRVWIEGFVGNQTELNQLQQSLKSLAADGKVQSQRASIIGPRDRLVFALSFMVDRTRGKN
ncbi:MAG: pilus assembly protein PilM [Bdellovibrionales bacterium]